MLACHSHRISPSIVSFIHGNAAACLLSVCHQTSMIRCLTPECHCPQPATHICRCNAGTCCVRVSCCVSLIRIGQGYTTSPPPTLYFQTLHPVASIASAITFASTLNNHAFSHRIIRAPCPRALKYGPAASSSSRSAATQPAATQPAATQPAATQPVVT